ncbi:thioredoxin-like domain-containing protein [Lacibacter luteus]|uniref:thioredoxin-like domain-containing protein n=1 Tax=Lacibacter luteus TaxID=2508719 RepID=UPI0013E999EB|nr:thioredoxin-like domain-containing protein [Lacibacter luteus]
MNSLFIFQLRKKDLAESIYSLSYKNEEGKLKKLNFYNHVLSNDSQKYVVDAFLIDSSYIAVTRSKQLNGYYTIKAGMETEVFFKTQMMNFGYLDADLSKRTEQFQLYTHIINNYQGSIFLPKKLNENKSTLKKAELAALLNGFNSKVSKNNSFQVLKKYAESKNDNPVFENYKFENQLGIATEIYSSNAKVNMIVFWASWCAPCRQEIPELKKIAAKYKPNQLNIVSISIDDSRKSWLSAVAAEQMNWPQLIIPENKRQQLKEQFEVGAIPYTLFLDSKGKLISRFIGNDQNTVLEYEQIINENLK